jgi:vacuolar iron transporter family protein
MPERPDDALAREHHPAAIRRRLDGTPQPQYLSDAVLGGIDGCITTFAIVAGAVGAGFSTVVALVLGFANLLADGFSMAISNYEAVQVKRDYVEDLRQQEHLHIDEVPEGEREEIRQIFQQKGFDGAVLERIVETITSNRDVWVDTMLTEEHGVERTTAHPLRAGLTTFAAFVVVGALPLLPLFLPLTLQHQFLTSALIAGAVFFAIGMVKGLAYARQPVWSGLRTLLSGGGAATLAFLVGYGLHRLWGVA